MPQWPVIFWPLKWDDHLSGQIWCKLVIWYLRILADKAGWPFNRGPPYNVGFVTYHYGQFVIWNEYGFECQRFYLQLHYHFNHIDTKFPYSLYHMSQYSFSSDFIFLSTLYYLFFVLPGNKKDSYIGSLGSLDSYYPIFTTSLLMNNATRVWLIGGTSKGHYYPGDEHRTRILDFKYRKLRFTAYAAY